MKAFLKNYNQSPRKVRLVTDLVKGRKVNEAITMLDFVNKRSAEQIKKTIASALANAKESGKKEENLFIKNITVDGGLVIKRWRPRARGRATPIRKRRSHINITLEEFASSKKEAKGEAPKKEVKKETKAKEAKAPAKKATAKTPAKKSATKSAAKKTTAKKVAPKAKVEKK